MTKTLSLCMIVKNAEKTLPACLESVKGIVDEIIIVDTGSSDWTKVIASNNNADVYDFEWDNDFANARNFALSQVKTDWVLMLDADETLVGNKEKIKELINKDYEKTPMYFLDIVTYTDPKKENKYYQRKIRLFPKNDNILFQYSLNEQMIHPNGTDNLVSLYAKGLLIKHYLEGGFKTKSKRNIAILKKEIKEHPTSFYYNYLLGKESILHNSFLNSLTAYEKAIESNEAKDPIIYSDICTDIIKILYKQRQLEEALNECIRREKICSINPEYWLTYGFISFKARDLETAKKCFMKCLETQPPIDTLLVDMSSITWKPNMFLGYINIKKRDFKSARSYLEKAIEYNPHNWYLPFYLGIACANLREYDSAETYFKTSKELISDKNAQELHLNMLLLYIMKGDFDQANDIVVDIVESFGINLQEEEFKLLDVDEDEKYEESDENNLNLLDYDEEPEKK